MISEGLAELARLVVLVLAPVQLHGFPSELAKYEELPEWVKFHLVSASRRCLQGPFLRLVTRLLEVWVLKKSNWPEHRSRPFFGGIIT